MDFGDIQKLVKAMRFRDWGFRLYEVEDPEFGVIAFLWVEFTAPDSETGKPSLQMGRRWALTTDMSGGEVIRTAWLAVHVALEHEAREEFTFAGKAVFNPHQSIKL